MPGYDLTGVFVGSEERWASPRKLPCEFSKQLNQFVFSWQILPALRQLAVSDIISAGIIPAGHGDDGQP